jgi:GPH family glycoside/pentoside/hexuronide:cation symporter
MSLPDQSQRLTVVSKLLYGMGDFGNAMYNSAIVFYLLIFYTDAVLIPPALVGSALLIGKIWDAINDPLIGWISDRTPGGRFGRRRAYMIIFAIPLGLSLMLLFFMPLGLSNAAIFAWIIVTFIVFDSFNTLTQVPYYALTAELTDDYDERSSLTMFRMLLGVPGYMIGAAITPMLVGLFLLKRTGYEAVGIIYGVIAILALLVSAAGIRERKAARASQSKMPPLRALLATLSNRPFVQLIVAYLIANLGFVLVQTLLAYFMEYQLNMKEQIPLVMFSLLGSVMIALAPWKKLSERWSKGPAYALGLAIGGLSVSSLFLLPHQPTNLVFLIAVIAGVGFSTNWVFPWAMVPDVVEYDELETGERRSGMIYGVWGFTSKLVAALGVAMSGWVLQLFHYTPNIAQTDFTLFGIRLFSGPVPALAIFISLPLLVAYPITRVKHARVRAQLAARSVEKPG